MNVLLVTTTTFFAMLNVRYEDHIHKKILDMGIRDTYGDSSMWHPFSEYKHTIPLDKYLEVP